MSKKNKVIVGVLVLVVVFVVGFLLGNSKVGTLGGAIHNTIETFPGIILGSQYNAACIKMQDSDAAGWSYVTILNGTVYATSTQPTICR